MLCSSGSDGCHSELPSPLCTCGVSPVSPASSPRGSFSAVLESSPAHGGPVWFSPSCERYKVLAGFGLQGGKLCPLNVVLYGPQPVLVVHLHPCLPALVRVIIVTIIIPASLSASTRIVTSGPAYATCAGTVTCAGTGHWLLAWFAPAGATCTASGLLAHLGPVCQLKTFAVGAVLVPVDFRHWDLLPMLFLEVGNELPHLVGTPASFFKSFLQGSCKTVVDKESCEGFSRGHMSWACWQGQVYLLLHMFRCPCSLHLLGVLIRGVLQHHLPVRTSPGLRVHLRVLLPPSSSHC